ncbi:MAG: FkbM family methyltransferase [Myxococcota bacterium]
MKRELVKRTKLILRRFGLQLKDYKWSEKHFDRLGIDVDTIIDVGVMHGTPELYAVFPDAHYILVEPQHDYDRKLTCRPRSFEWRNVAVGSTKGTLTLNVSAGMSSLLNASAQRHLPIHQRYEVDVTTLDEIISSIRRPPRFGLKIDVEGYELQALQGLQAEAEKVEFILVEVALQNMYERKYRCSELFSYLGDIGFELVDILNLPNNVPAIMDMLFLQRDHVGFARAPNFR